MFNPAVSALLQSTNWIESKLKYVLYIFASHGTLNERGDGNCWLNPHFEDATGKSHLQQADRQA